ncbi:GxxExxY protein [Sorangium sp. So ce1036]|uniref:GxxExxY protein n=1 Tax=Sorangium sp. So ce1036 TaxID=3133328 RepID=UPI003F027506
MGAATGDDWKIERRDATEVGEGRIDLLVAERLVVELKVVEHLAPIRVAQVLSCLKTMRLPIGPLITFNVPALRLGIKHVVHNL